uniref:Chitin-binding type-2 domain-containing protein n=1 Tax=Megaselia scalaris TaxID=36166 RepID=T1GP32_MEGSC
MVEVTENEVMLVIRHNGRSACSSQEEIDTKYYANNFDPTKYWHCEAMNVPATDKQCGVERAFHQKKRECVPWNQWQWFPYDDPPNKA